MPRKTHFNFPGVTQLIIQKSNKNAPCFFVDKDYQHYLHDLYNLSAKYNCHIHSYVLMPDHVQILATPYLDSGISHLMQELSQRHVNHINTTYGQAGSLWGGGYKSCLVDSEQYLLTCMRYIELIPVRSGVVEQAADYRWSSYHFNAFNKEDEIIISHPDYMDLADTEERRLAAYIELFEEEITSETISDIKEALGNQDVLGPATLKEKVEELANKKKAEEEGCTTCHMFY